MRSAGRLVSLLVAFFCLVSAYSQIPSKSEKKHRIISKGPQSIRTFDADAPCKFAPLYEKIKADKTDPRVAFVETFGLLHGAGAALSGWDESPFQSACRAVSNQTPNSEAFFDGPHKFFQIIVPEDTRVYHETLTYFAGAPGHPGVMLDFQNESDDFKAVALSYRDAKWQDETARYLAPLKLPPTVFLILPQFGLTARVLTFDEDAPARKDTLRHKGWLTWDGEKFSLSSTKSHAGWRCPDNTTRLLSGYFGESASKTKMLFCQ